MAKYQKKPIVIEAIQWNGSNLKEIIDFIGLPSCGQALKWGEQ